MSLTVIDDDKCLGFNPSLNFFAISDIGPFPLPSNINPLYRLFQLNIKELCCIGTDVLHVLNYLR